MKKITLKIMMLMFILLGFLSTSFVSINAQCIRPDAFGNVVSNNSGLLQGITTCAYSSAEYSTVTGLTLGEDYVFAGQVGTVTGAGNHIYVTITDLSNTVIQHGVSPQTVTNIGVTGVRIHLSDNAACAGTAVCHNTSVLLITSCIVPSGLTSANVTTTTADISWTAPVNVPSNGYDYYYSTVNTAPIATTTPNGNVASGTSVNLTGLNPSSQYYYWIRSNCGTETSSWSTSGTFTTACVAISVPSLETFTTFLPPCWEKASGGDIISGPATPGAGNWFADGFANVGTTGAVRYNFFTANTNDWLISPSFIIPSTGYELKFDAAATQYASTAAPTTPWEADDIIQVLVSTGTTNWTVLYTYDSTHAPSNTGSVNILDLSAYSGQTVRFAYRMVEGIDNGAADIDFFVDNFQIRLTPSCAEPISLLVNNITTSSAELSWTETGSASLWNIEYGPVGFTQGTGTIVNGVTNPYVLTGLTSNTVYDYYVQADCSSSLSYWSGPTTFVTNCLPFGSFVENFDSTTSGTMTNCWTGLKVTTDNFARVSVQDNIAFTEPNSAELYNSGDANALLFLVTPNLTNLPNGTHRLKFRVSGGTNYTIEVGTMTNPTDAATFTSVEPFQTPAGFVEYIVDFSQVTTTDNYIAIKHGLGGTFRTIKIDDVIWEPVPAAAPVCASNVVATPNATCGNFANLITWDATSGADGYNITVGTTSGGNDISNNVNLGNVTSYSFTGNFNTTYYYTVVPFNAIGSATACTEQSFTTFATGCYCTSVPTSNDGLGITNVQLATTNFPTNDVTYFDHTATAVTLPQGLNTNVQVTFATGYAYATYIWIDFNDNLTFEASELVFNGVSTNANPTVLNASFVMPAAATVGTHRMRMATGDANFLTTADPCYSGSYGVTLDFSVNIIVAGCTPPAATATVVPNCTTNEYSVDVNVTALGSGTPSISNGTITWPVTATGVVTVGPFTSGSSQTLTILHGSDTSCDLPLGSYNYSCPPVNDDLCNAIALTLNAPATGSDYSLSAATSQTSEPVPSCFSGGINGSVWFSFVAPSSGAVDVTTDFAGGTLTDGDTEIAVYAATGVTCSDLTTLGAPVGCDQDGGTTVNYASFLSLTGLTSGNTYYIQVDRYSGTTAGSFGIQVNTVLNTNNFDNASFVAYPNPVNDVLNLSYSAEITSVRVMNLLGQEVISRKVGSTSTQLDMSNLTVGAYIVNITIDDVVKSVKVIKQ